MSKHFRHKAPFFLPASPSAEHRSEEIPALVDLLSAKRRVVLHGPDGIGKTTLAVAAADRWCDGGEAREAIYLSFASGADATWVVDAMGVLLAGPEFMALQRDRRLPAVLKAASTRPIVVIWDHIDRVSSAPWDGGDTTLRPILQFGVELTQTSLTRLVVVGREEDLDYVPYHPSRRVEALAVGSRDAAECSPLAMRLLLASGGVAPPGGSASLEDAFDRFWSGLDEPTVRGLSATAALRDGAPEHVWRSVCGLDPTRCDALLNLLERSGLAHIGTPGHPDRRLDVHDSFRALVLPRADAGALAEAEERHRRAYLELAYEWSGGGSPTYPALVLREFANLLVALARTLESDHDYVAALADALQELLGPPPPEAPILIRRVLATAEALGVRTVHPVGT